MNIDENAPIRARASVEISAPPEEVWRVITDFERWPEWNPDVKQVTLGGPVVRGTEFRWKSGPSTITSTLQVVEPPRSLAWTGRTFGIRAVHVWTFEARDGRTLAVTAESWDGWLPRLLRSPLRKQLRTGLDRGLAHLKAAAERRAGAPGATGEAM